MSGNYFCHVCGGLVDLIKLQPSDVRLCECEKRFARLRAENNRLKAENKLYAAEMSAAKEDGFYSAQDLYSSYVGAEERVNTLESELAACREDAERWKYARRKMCLTGNGDGTCMMHGINFPADIPGWPEPGKVEEFCDAAIDSARAKEGGSE